MSDTIYRRGPLASIGVYVVLGLVVLLALFPFLYMISLSLQSDADLFSGVPVIIPSTLQFTNYVEIWERAPFARFVLNSFIIAGGITALHLIFDPLIGYVFAKMNFPGKDTMFGMGGADIFRAKPVDTTTSSFIFEITGRVSKVEQFIAIMAPLGLVEVCRTGVAAMNRGPQGMEART